MKTMLAVLISLLGVGLAYASGDQREDCNRKAEGVKGAEHDRIVSACVRHNARINTVPPTLAKMMECNRKAGDMTGETRVQFVDKCMNE